jgi:hypothetical protein
MDIEKLTIDELIVLNHRVIARLRYLQGLKTRAHLDRFEVGDRVSFQSDGRTVEGLVVRVNQKSLSVRTLDSNWTIHPRFLTKLIKTGAPGPKTVEDILGRDQGAGPS